MAFTVNQVMTGDTLEEFEYAFRARRRTRPIFGVDRDVSDFFLALRYNRCGKSNCACQKDPAKRHGPYWLWTAKVDDKTVNRKFSEHEARRYQEWIANDRHVRQLLAQMRAVAARATQLLLSEDPGE